MNFQNQIRSNVPQADLAHRNNGRNPSEEGIAEGTSQHPAGRGRCPHKGMISPYGDAMWPPCRIGSSAGSVTLREHKQTASGVVLRKVSHYINSSQSTQRSQSSRFFILERDCDLDGNVFVQKSGLLNFNRANEHSLLQRYFFLTNNFKCAIQPDIF
jgi:hypothetical protein